MTFLYSRVAILCVSLLLLGGCAQLPKEFRYHAGQEIAQAPVWPDEPEPPRYRYFGQLTGEENFYRPGEETANAGVRFFRWLVGLTGYSSNPVLLQRPQAVITDHQGRIYVSDVSRHAVYVFDEGLGDNTAELKVWEFAAKGLRFQLPIGMALTAEGELLVADAQLKLVARLNAQGEPVGQVGDGGLQHPTGVAIDPVTGQIYVADRGANQIVVFDKNGKKRFSFSEFGEDEGQLNGPTYLSWYKNRLYVTDTLNARIQIFSADGEFESSFGRRGLYLGELPRPKGVTVDQAGNIYVVESYYDYLLVFNHKGEFLLPIGGSGHKIGQFYLPAGVWADNNNRIYVADMFNGRVMIFEYLGDLDGSDVAEGRNSAAGDANSL
jgi:DNA-binding beta-propeller fold protein YncE